MIQETPPNNENGPLVEISISYEDGEPISAFAIRRPLQDSKIAKFPNVFFFQPSLKLPNGTTRTGLFMHNDIMYLLSAQLFRRGVDYMEYTGETGGMMEGIMAPVREFSLSKSGDELTVVLYNEGPGFRLLRLERTGLGVYQSIYLKDLEYIKFSGLPLFGFFYLEGHTDDVIPLTMDAAPIRSIDIE